jgi:hypothetical protein
MRFFQAGVLLLGAAMYVFFLLNVSNTDMAAQLAEATGPTFIGWNVALLVVAALAIVDSVIKVRKGKTAQLAIGVFVVKLAAIPFFVINFALLALTGLAGLALTMHGIGIGLIFVVLISVVLTYLAMVSTSVYGWASVRALRREGRLSRGLAVLYSLLLLVFVADIVAGILLFAHSRRGRVSARAADTRTLDASGAFTVGGSPTAQS